MNGLLTYGCKSNVILKYFVIQNKIKSSKFKMFVNGKFPIQKNTKNA